MFYINYMLLTPTLYFLFHLFSYTVTLPQGEFTLGKGMLHNGVGPALHICWDATDYMLVDVMNVHSTHDKVVAPSHLGHSLKKNEKEGEEEESISFLETTTLKSRSQAKKVRRGDDTGVKGGKVSVTEKEAEQEREDIEKTAASFTLPLSSKQVHVDGKKKSTHKHHDHHTQRMWQEDFTKPFEAAEKSGISSSKEGHVHTKDRKSAKEMLAAFRDALKAHVGSPVKGTHTYRHQDLTLL